MRRTLVEEGIHAFAEIAAHVAHQDQVLALLARQPPHQARQRLLGRRQRQRRVGGDRCGKLAGALVQGVEVLHHFGEQADVESLLGADQPGGENQVFDPRWPNQGGEPADARHRQAIAERAGDGKADPRGLGADAQIAAGGNRTTTARAGAADRRNSGHPALLERGRKKSFSWIDRTWAWWRRWTASKRSSAVEGPSSR